MRLWWVKWPFILSQLTSTGAIYIDQGLATCRRFFAQWVFPKKSERPLLERWLAPKRHPLQEVHNLMRILSPQNDSDRHLIDCSSTMQKFVELENQTGVQFRHMKLLIQAFTHPSVSNGLDLLDVGSNQRLEFLGDAVLQFITSRFLFIHFPEHQEGQLTVGYYYFRCLQWSYWGVLLWTTRSSLTWQLSWDLKSIFDICPQSLCYKRGGHTGECWQTVLRVNDVAKEFDNSSAFLAALYLDKDLDAVDLFAQVVLFPRIRKAIAEKEWLDPKTRLQQTVLAITKNRNFSPTYK